MDNGIVPVSKGDLSKNRQMEKLRKYIDDNYMKPLVLDDLAKQMHLNKNYLCRLFKKYTGKSIIAYQLERKIQNAILQLRCSDKKILAIAIENGFNDLAFFNKKFKEFVGSTPGEIRAL